MKRTIRLNESELKRMISESVRRVLKESMTSTVIPSDFTEYDNNTIDLGDHTLSYFLDGVEEGESENDTIYHERIVVQTADGRKKLRGFSERAIEATRWQMYFYYEMLCKELGIQPAKME